jgi:hypothetical protein
MAQQLYLFLQIELPWALGPADGRYLLRREAGAEPERVVVLGTLGAPRRHRRHSPRRSPKTNSEPVPVLTARATVVDPIPLSAETQARSWLAELDAEHETRVAFAVLNRVLFAHRIAGADPYVHEVSPAQALVIRAGWGEGEQVADGHWLHARELPLPEPGSRRRVSALRPQERLAVLLGGRGKALLCEELTLRARLDLDHERIIHAAVQLERAFAVALPELGVEKRPDLALRLVELEKLRPGVSQAALAALTGGRGEPDEEIVRFALERLEATLRARTATGFAR